MKVKAKEATGVLREILINIDEKELTETRKNMMQEAELENNKEIIL